MKTLIFLGEGLQLASDFQRDLLSKQVKKLSHGERSLGVIIGSIHTQLIHVQVLIQDLGQEVMGNRLQTEQGASFLQFSPFSLLLSENSMQGAPPLEGMGTKAYLFYEGCSVHTMPVA